MNKPTQTAGGWFKVDNEAVGLIATTGAAAWAVYCVLCRYVENGSRTAFPSIKTIRRLTGFSKSRIQRAIKTLEGAEVIRVTRGGGRPGQSCNANSRYYLPPIGPGIKNDPGSQNDTSPRCQIDALPRSQNDTSPVSKTTPEKDSLIKRPTKKKNAQPGAVAIPSNLHAEPFLTAWQDWEQHRREIKKPLTPTAAATQLAKLAAVGPTRAAEILQTSIANGWQGLFYEPKPTGKSKATAGPGITHPDDPSWNF